MISLFLIFLNLVPNGVTVSKNKLNYTYSLTFDDGPGETTNILLDTLHKYKLKVTFFVNGSSFCWEEPKYLKRLLVLKREVKEGHLIGNHTYRHYNMSKLTARKQVFEIHKNELIIKKLLGVTPVFYRPPSGIMTLTSYRYLRDNGYYKAVLWDISSGDYRKRSKKYVYNVVRERMEKRKSGVVLLHDTNLGTVHAAASLLKYFYTKNCLLLKEKKSPQIYVFLRIDSYYKYMKMSIPQKLKFDSSKRAELKKVCSTLNLQ